MCPRCGFQFGQLQRKSSGGKWIAIAAVVAALAFCSWYGMRMMKTVPQLQPGTSPTGNFVDQIPSEIVWETNNTDRGTIDGVFHNGPQALSNAYVSLRIQPDGQDPTDTPAVQIVDANGGTTIPSGGSCSISIPIPISCRIVEVSVFVMGSDGNKQYVPVSYYYGPSFSALGPPSG
jgi:hypothetical protein